jgi:hypothetical protein
MRAGKWRRPGKSILAGNELGMEREGKEREGGNKGGLENLYGLEMKETKKMNAD